MKAIILAGGKGTRIQEMTTSIPKPLIEVGGQPILWHIMKIYESFGITEFCIALGYKGNLIKEYFLNYNSRNSDFTVNTSTNEVIYHHRSSENWTVQLVDTGENTETGGRVKRLESYIEEDEFLLTYGDGVSDVNINETIKFHQSHGKLATVTAVRPPAKFGSLELSGDKVSSFLEKPKEGEAWVNGGFFVLNKKVFDYIDGDRIPFEHKPLERLSQENELVAYKHPGFWQCMDTMRDHETLNKLCDIDQALWKTW